MKRIYKTETIRRVLPVLLLMCIITPGIVWSAEVEQVSVGPITAALAVMVPGQTKTYTVESELYPAVMIVPVVIYGTGNFAVTVTKTDTSGELFGVMQVGGYSTIQIGTQYGAAVGVTPITIRLAARFYDSAFIVVMSGLLATIEEGPYRYSITLNVT
jgi:hypothetical protein